jgi:RNA polymerase sigma-70 factor (ECF subfamily)
MTREAGTLDALTLRCSQGDRAALQELLAEVRPAVLRYFFAQGLPRHDAEDVTQEVCVALARTLPEWQERGSSVWAFVFTVARRRLADHRRAALRAPVPWEQTPDAADGAAGPEDFVLADDGLRELGRLIQDLPRNQRDVLVLRVVVGLSVAETAQAVGLAHGSVHVLQHRALTALRAAFALQAAQA